MTWPLEPRGIAKFAHGLDTILVIEEKRSLIETQVKEQFYDTPDRPRVLGKKDEGTAGCSQPRARSTRSTSRQ